MPVFSCPLFGYNIHCMKKTVIGILAHVDAGKTTCIESMLYLSGTINKAGRVDHKDAFLDFDEQEKDHGITIYSKEAFFSWKDTDFYVIDTPGHVDFSSEMERALQVLDLAVILINGQDGVQSHTETIWKCLEYYHVPAVIFVNKMDISHLSKEEILADLSKHCSENVIDFESDERDEKLAVISEEMLNRYLEEGIVPDEMIRDAVYERKCFPCVFGAALKHQGTEKLMDLLASLSEEREYGEEFGARVYKISSDEQDSRLTHVRITSGRLQAKQKISETEKVDQIRLYNGRSWKMLNEAEAGSICVLKGLKSFEAGQGMGIEKDSERPLLNAYMNYRLILPEGADVLQLSKVCRQLADEDPQLQMDISEESGVISVQIMGTMQMEVLQKKIREKSGFAVGFGAGKIIFRETIAGPVKGYGHFEPLRHYAEAHVRLEPLKRGSGIEVVNDIPNGMLSESFQRSVVSAAERKLHRGVLTGSLLTDVRIVITAAKGHLKHTEGGDFRQAVSRAVRQALMQADNLLLEPFCSFTLQIPEEILGRALYDLEMKHASAEIAGTELITGRGPLRLLMHYQNEVTAYSRGRGKFRWEPDGYDVCEDAAEIIRETGYDPESDLRNPPDSVFCTRGAGYTVPWQEAEKNMHIQVREKTASSYQTKKYRVSEEDMKHILEMASGRNRNEQKKERPAKKKPEKETYHNKEEVLPGCLIVDGYNMIYSWEELKELAKEDLRAARDRLIEILMNYQAFTGEMMILVFDGYKVKDNIGSVFVKDNMMTVYTKENQTADAYIEKTAHDLRGKYRITVASSDALIQNAVFSQSALRMSGRELKSRIDMTNLRIQDLMKSGM